MGGYAWVTLATNDSYSLGALVLAYSLKISKTAHKLVVLITPAVSQSMREKLQTVFDVIKVVDVLDSKDEAHLALMQRPELGITFTKIHCWRLVEFDKCVFLDADTLVVRNCDELFEREEFSAAPDVSWPDCFNSGVFVYKPSLQTFDELLQFAVEKGSFDGGDQGLLNQFFRDWATEDIKKHLPFVYNLTSIAAYSYIPAFKHYGSETRIVHFIGTGKPWLQQLDPATRTITPTSGSEHLTPLLQQWWDIFCEKVHPNLDKSLASSNDGMSHPPVAACSNSLPVALTDDSQTPRLVEFCTPYREKDDFRQYNLPYQPFDVKGSSGELLNEEYLLASVVHPTPPEVNLDEQQRQEGYGMEDGERQEERNDTEKTRESDLKENEVRKETLSVGITLNTNPDTELKEIISESKEIEAGEQKQEDENQGPSKELEQPSPSEHPFDYNNFVPDEACINKYLEQNVITYQPYDNNHRHHQQQRQEEEKEEEEQQQQPQNPHPDSSEKNSQPSLEGSEIDLSVSDTQPSEDPAPSLPRFLTIPENDRRQSGNTETYFQTKQPAPKSDLSQADHRILTPDQTFPLKETVQEKRELTKSKSMPYLGYDVIEMPSSGSIWKSQPNVNVDPNKKYSMPKLKPILPRQNSLRKSVSSIIPKVTLYTEFFMSSEYKDPEDLPKDKVGFVDTFIHKKGQLRRTKSAADIADKFGPLPYISSPEIERPPASMKMPSLHLENELYDLSQCKRQMGNKPKAKDASKRKSTSHSLPALKPLVPPKDKKSTLIKKRKSKELTSGDGGREKIFKKEPKMPKERKREFKTIPRNVSEVSSGNNLNEILLRLREFSKHHQHFFGVESEPRKSTVKCRNATVQADDLVGSEWDASEIFLKMSSPSKASVSQTTQTAREENSEQQDYTVDSKFRQFRNYVKEKSETSQKGLLGIQELVSKASGREDEVMEEVNTSSEILENCSESKGGSKKNSVKTVDDQVDSVIDSLVETMKPEEGININHQGPANETEIAKDHQSNSKLCVTVGNDNRIEDNSNEMVKKSVSRLTCEKPKEIEREDAVKNFDCFSPSDSSLTEDKSKCNTTASNHSEESNAESQCPPLVSDAENAPNFSSQEGKGQTNGFEIEIAATEGSFSLEMKINDDLVLAKKEDNVRETKEVDLPLKSDSGEGAVRTAHTSSLYSDSLTPVRNGCPEHFRVAAEPGKLQPEAETLSEPRTNGFADRSSPKKTFSEIKELKTEIKGNSITESPKNSPIWEEKGQIFVTSLSCGKKERERKMKEKRSHDKLKNMKKASLEASCSSCIPLLPPKNIAIEAVEGTLQPTCTLPPQSPTSLKTPTSILLPRYLPNIPPTYSNNPPNNSPDATSPPVGERNSSTQLFPPHNGNSLPGSHEDSNVMSGIAGAIAQLNLEERSGQSSESAAAASISHQEYVRRQNWETGNMDYMGRDSFDNIWSKICQTLEGKEAEEAGAAAVSPQQCTKTPNPSAAVSTEEAKTSEQLLAAETPSLSTVLQKCPEFIELLPGEPAAGPVEDDEIIFSKPDNRQSCLTESTEVEESGKESSALGAKPTEAEKVQPSNILQQKGSSSDGEKSKKTDIVGELEKPSTVLVEARAPEQKATGDTCAQEKAEAPAVEKNEKSQEKPGIAKVEPEPQKVECQTVAICLPLLPSQQLLHGGVTNILETTDKPKSEPEKAEKCTVVAIPSPPIIHPVSPLCEKDKKTQSRIKLETSAEEKFEPIPLPPPEIPLPIPTLAPGEDAPVAKSSDSVKDQGKQKKGVFTKILEMVGVTPKEKAGEISKSVFYNVEEDGTEPTKPEPSKDENATAIELVNQAPTAATETSEVPPKKVDEAGKVPDFEKKKIIEVKVDPITQSKDTEVSVLKLEEKSENTSANPPEMEGTEKTAGEKPHESIKSDAKPKLSIEKPPRNVSPKEPTELPKKSTEESPKSISPSPKLFLSKEPPVMAITMPTPPPQPDYPLQGNLLKVDETILETPPIPPELHKEVIEESVKGKVLTEVEDIIGKAKSEVENLLQNSRGADKKDGESSDSINMMKMLVSSEQAEQCLSPEVQMEELRVTSEEERMRHKGEVVSSKLSDQILKAIPPPRRKAISEGSASTSAIPKPPPAPEQKSVSGENKPKAQKPSSIPVPPPRNRGKPAQPTPPKGKGKK